jgi:hypothetical protein
VATPTADHVIHLACIATGKDYRASGLTLDRVGLGGRTLPDVTALLNHGYGN